jgi:hypothetical protein
MPQESYLVQGPDGLMVTILAFSLDGAKRLYLAQARRRKLKRGDPFSIKPRGYGDWVHYSVI